LPRPVRRGFQPWLLVKNSGQSATDSFMILMWYHISMSVGYFPLPSTDNWSSFFFPSSVPLLPAPPS
jgi:hypothetical protein